VPGAPRWPLSQQAAEQFASTLGVPFQAYGAQGERLNGFACLALGESVFHLLHLVGFPIQCSF
jgi:hypothetical protein